MWLQWTGFIAGTIGMMLWAANNSFTKWAGLFWILSSICWIYVGWMEHQPALMFRDAINIVIYVIGIYKWMKT
jgi:hypothetical protein